jgi:hypothetical protein
MQLVALSLTKYGFRSTIEQVTGSNTDKGLARQKGHTKAAIYDFD